MDFDDLDLHEPELRPAPVPVRVVPLQRRLTDAPVEAEGRFAASRAVLLKSQSSGVVEGLEVGLGDPVHKGQVICTVGAQMADQRVLATRATIAQLEAQLAEREDAMLQARRRGEDPDRLASFEHKLRAVEHKLMHERLQLERQTILRSSLEVHAPFSARVASVSAASGGSIMSGHPIVELVEVDPILLVLDVPTWVASRCATGDEVRVRTTSHTELRIGRIARWAPTALDTVRRILVEVDNADGRIAAGESACAELDVGERLAYFAPRAALHHLEKGIKLQLVEHSKVLERIVRVLGGNEQEVEVSGVLSPSQLVVLDADRPLTEATEVVIRGDH